MAERNPQVPHSIDSLLYVKRNWNYCGYKLELITDSISGDLKEFLICSECKGISRRARQWCNKTTCMSCVKGPVVNIDGRVENKVKLLNSKCPLSGNGCDWAGVLGDIEKHMKVCMKVLVECQQKCGIAFERETTEQHNKEVCPMRTKECEYCKQQVRVREENQHIGKCTDHPDTEVPCPYKELGCDAISPRNRMERHQTENTIGHQKLVLDQLSQLRNRNKQLEQLNVQQKNRIETIETLVTYREREREYREREHTEIEHREREHREREHREREHREKEHREKEHREREHREREHREREHREREHREREHREKEHRAERNKRMGMVWVIIGLVLVVGIAITVSVSNNVAHNSQQIQTNTEKTNSNLKQIQANTEKTNSNLKQIQANTQQTKSNQKQIQANTQQTKSNQKQIQANTQQTESNLKQIQANIEKTASNLKQIQANIEKTASNLKQIQANTEKTASNLKQIQINSQYIQLMLDRLGYINVSVLDERKRLTRVEWVHTLTPRGDIYGDTFYLGKCRLSLMAYLYNGMTEASYSVKRLSGEYDSIISSCRIPYVYATYGYLDDIKPEYIYLSGSNRNLKVEESFYLYTKSWEDLDRKVTLRAYFVTEGD